MFLTDGVEISIPLYFFHLSKTLKRTVFSKIKFE